MSTLSQKNGIRASRDYRCALCGELIEAGSRYDKRAGVNYGDFWVMKMHPECHTYECSGAVDADWYEDVFDPAFTRADALKFVAENSTKNPAPCNDKG